MSKVNIKLIRRVADQIEANPDGYGQANYVSPCGTRHCIAGWVCILSGCEIRTNEKFGGLEFFNTLDDCKIDASDFAIKKLRFPFDEGMRLFAPHFEPGGKEASPESTVEFLRMYADLAKQSNTFVSIFDPRFQNVPGRWANRNYPDFVGDTSPLVFRLFRFIKEATIE